MPQVPVSPATPLGAPPTPLLATLAWAGGHAALVFDGADLTSVEANLVQVGCCNAAFLVFLFLGYFCSN